MQFQSALHTREYAITTCDQIMAHEANEVDGWTYLPTPVDPSDPNSLYRSVVLAEDFNKLGIL